LFFVVQDALDGYQQNNWKGFFKMTWILVFIGGRRLIAPVFFIG